MFNEKNNKYAKTVREGVDTKNMSFAPLKDFVGRDIIVDGFFFTDGKYGKQCVVVSRDGVLVNMPKRYSAEFEDFAKNEEELNAILDGHLALANVRMIDTKNGTTVCFDYKDI